MGKASGSIVFKSIAGVVLVIAVFSVVICVIGYNAFTSALVQQYSADAIWTAQMSRLCIDVNYLSLYTANGGQNWEYENVRELLQMICDSTGVAFIYVIQPDTSDYRHITFLFSVMNKNSNYTVYDYGYVRETTNDEYAEKYRSLYEGTADQAIVIRDEDNIETEAHITVMVPLKASFENNAVKAILCVQVQMDGLQTARMTYIRRVIIALAVLALIVIATQGYYLHRVLLMPVKKVSEEASRFARENVQSGTKLKSVITRNDEMGNLAKSIDHMEEQIESYINNITEITAEKERINTELTLASKIQADALPNSFPAFPERNEFEIFASMDPAKEVGGDFYDFFLIDDNHLCLEIADVSGKGIPAALFMMSAKNIIANNAMNSTSPAEILAQTNNTLCSNNIEDMFVTVWLGILEISTGKIVAANAGHEYPVLMHEGGKFEYIMDQHGPVLGGLDGMKYSDYEIQLRKGSKLFVYTDGVPEATDSSNRMFGQERLLDALNDRSDCSPQEILGNVTCAVDGFVQDAEQFDDLTMLCIEYRKS